MHENSSVQGNLPSDRCKNCFAAKFRKDIAINNNEYKQKFQFTLHNSDIVR